MNFIRGRILVLVFSSLSLYHLAPTLDRAQGFLVSTAFALILILSSRVVMVQRHLLKYACYWGVSVFTYFILFDFHLWDFLVHGGLWESTALPLVVCSIIMSIAGWLLLSSWADRWIYTGITLGLQIPVGLTIGSDIMQTIMTQISHIIHYSDYYSGSWQFWQFEWMMTYYLPIYFLTYRKRRPSNS